MQRYNARSSVITKNGGTTHVGPHRPLSIAITTITRRFLDIPTIAPNEEATITNLARINTLIPGNTLSAAAPASEGNTVHITDTTTIASSPFLKLPGELRNRIYRLYFEDFEEQMSRRFPYSKSKMSSNYLALMHTNRMVRSEAASVFYKEVAPFHSFTCPTDQPIEAVTLTRIRDVCSLISIRDAHMSISIRCTPSWKDYGDAWHRNNDRWRGREIKAFASCALVQVSYTARPPGLTRYEAIQWMQGVHDSWSSVDSDHTNEARTTTGFVVKYRDEGVRENENFVQIEGSLAEVNWSRGWHF
jgi:hypothetical protein